MEFIVSGQTRIFLLACLMGVGLSLVYDVFRILRITVKSGRFATLVQDIVFFLLVTGSTFLFFLRFTEGMIRFYVLIGELLGFVICHLTASAVIVKVLGTLIRTAKCALSFVFRKALRPFFGALSKYMRKICKFSVNKLRKYTPKRKKDLQKTNKIMYNHTIRFQKMKKTKVGKRMAKSKRKSRKKNIAIALLVLALAAYAIVSLSVSSAKIAEERKQIAYLQSQKEELETQGKEYDRLTQEYDKQVEEGETIEYAEKVAREKLGLVSPDERVWIDIAGS